LYEIPKGLTGTIHFLSYKNIFDSSSLKKVELIFFPAMISMSYQSILSFSCSSSTSPGTYVWISHDSILSEWPVSQHKTAINQFHFNISGRIDIRGYLRVSWLSYISTQVWRSKCFQGKALRPDFSDLKPCGHNCGTKEIIGH